MKNPIKKINRIFRHFQNESNDIVIYRNPSHRLGCIDSVSKGYTQKLLDGRTPAFPEKGAYSLDNASKTVVFRHFLFISMTLLKIQGLMMEEIVLRLI